jgi:hypothetical protein
VERASETATYVLSLWLAALLVACGMVIGGVKARSYVLRELRTLTIPSQMKDRPGKSASGFFGVKFKNLQKGDRLRLT